MLIFHIGIAFIDMTHPDKAKHKELQGGKGFFRVFFLTPQAFMSYVFRISISRRRRLRIRFGFFACQDKIYQLFRVIKAVVVACDSLPVIYNTVFLVFLKTVKQLFLTVAPYKHCKAERLYFAEEPFAALSTAVGT